MTLITFWYILCHISILYRTIFSFVCFYSTLFFCTTFYSLHNLHDILQFIMINSISLQTAFDFVKIFLCFRSSHRTCSVRRGDSGTGVFLWILQNFYEHFFLQNTSGRLLLSFHWTANSTSKQGKKWKEKNCYKLFLKKISLLYQVSAISLY